MNTPQIKQKKNLLNILKFSIASLSITSLIGLWNLFSREESNNAITPEQNKDNNFLNSPLPTLIPSVLDESASDLNVQQIEEIEPEKVQPTEEPVIERVVIGSSGGSGGGAPAAKTSSSR